MAVTATLSNHFKYQKNVGNINFSSDTIKIILMNDSFAFNKDTHATLADVTANQLATEYGYTQNDETLANVSVSEDDTNDKCTVTWDDPSWTASGGSIGPTGSCCLIDDTTADDTVIGCIDFGTDYTIPNGTTFSIQNIQVDDE